MGVMAANGLRSLGFTSEISPFVFVTTQYGFLLSVVVVAVVYIHIPSMCLSSITTITYHKVSNTNLIYEFTRLALDLLIEVS